MEKAPAKEDTVRLRGEKKGSLAKKRAGSEKRQRKREGHTQGRQRDASLSTKERKIENKLIGK